MQGEVYFVFSTKGNTRALTCISSGDPQRYGTNEKETKHTHIYAHRVCYNQSTSCSDIAPYYLVDTPSNRTSCARGPCLTTTRCSHPQRGVRCQEIFFHMLSISAAWSTPDPGILYSPACCNTDTIATSPLVHVILRRSSFLRMSEQSLNSILPPPSPPVHG